MFSNKRWLLIPAFLAAVIVLAACGTAPAATEETTPVPTEVATAAPTEAPTPAETFKGLDYSADCAKQAGSSSPIKEMAATDELTVTITMCQPDPAFPSKIAFTSFGIEPAAYIEKTGGGGDILSKPIGTGPYSLTEWKKGESMTFTKFPDYWGDKAKTDTLVFRWASESAARLTELQAGTVDGIDNPGPEDFDKIKADSTLQLLPREALNVMYIGMTNTKKPFDNEKVRQAIAQGIDRQRIVDTFYPPGSEVAKYFTPCAIPNACGGDEWYTFDAAAAKKELADAGFPNGFTTKLYYRDVVRGYLPNVNQVAADIAAQLKANLGITAVPTKMESGAFIAFTQKGDADGLYLLGWGADYPHITDFLDVHFGKGNAQFGDPFPDIYDLLTQGSQTTDAAKATDLYTQANNLIKQHVPMIPVAHGASAAAYRADVTGAQASPLTNEQFYVTTPGTRTQFVWMQNAEPISMYCADESDGESLRACAQVTEPLLNYKIDGTDVVPGLATSCDPNKDLTVWTCHLRSGVKFHDGSTLTANDVVESLYVQWDASSPLHVGNAEGFYYMANLFGLINVPPPTPTPAASATPTP